MTNLLTLITAVAIGTSALAQVPAPPSPAPVAPVAPVAPIAPVAPPAPAPFVFYSDHDDSLRFATDTSIFEFEFERSLGNLNLLAQATPRLAPAPRPIQINTRSFEFGNEENAYQSGQRALDNRQWDQALNSFSRVTTGPRADGALYWKAYTLNKLNRRDDAQAAIAELRRAYASSRWLEDARALELQIRQATGQNVSPENESDEELKLLALNGLMQSDPDRALPLVENLLKSTQSPKLKKQAVFVLTQTNSPRARTLLEQIARGGNNPDLQLTAINYLSAQRRGQSNSGDLLWEIYNSSTDASVKRQILNSFAGSNDRDHLMQVVKTEKATDLRLTAIQHLGGASYSNELWQLYQSETSPDVKRTIINMMSSGGNSERLLEIVRTEKDVNLRRQAIQQVTDANALVSLYSAEQDTSVRQSIIDSVGGRNNPKALVALARAEKDPKLKMRIVQRLSTMKSPEATDYMIELLGTK